MNDQPRLSWDYGTAYDLFASLHVLHEPEKLDHDFWEGYEEFYDRTLDFSPGNKVFRYIDIYHDVMLELPDKPIPLWRLQK